MPIPLCEALPRGRSSAAMDCRGDHGLPLARIAAGIAACGRPCFEHSHNRELPGSPRPLSRMGNNASPRARPSAKKNLRLARRELIVVSKSVCRTRRPFAKTQSRAGPETPPNPICARSREKSNFDRPKIRNLKPVRKVRPDYFRRSRPETNLSGFAPRRSGDHEVDWSFLCRATRVQTSSVGPLPQKQPRGHSGEPRLQVFVGPIQP